HADAKEFAHCAVRAVTSGAEIRDDLALIARALIPHARNNAAAFEPQIHQFGQILELHAPLPPGKGAQNRIEKILRTALALLRALRRRVFFPPRAELARAPLVP